MDSDYDPERWELFQNSFIRTPILNNKGKEGAIIDFALLAYEGVISGKSLSKILWAWSKTLLSFLNSDFNITLNNEEIKKLEEMLSPSILIIMEMHISSCLKSYQATQKLGLLPKNWDSQKKEITVIDAKFEPVTKTEVLESERPKETMASLQDNLLKSFVRPAKRQVGEIPQNEKMVLAAFNDAKFRLQTNLAKIDRTKRLELQKDQIVI